MRECGCECTGAGVCLRACSLTNPACNAPPYCHVRHLAASSFSTLSDKRHDFRKKKVTEREMCILAFITNFIPNILILRRIQRDIVINVKTSSCKVPLFVEDFNETKFCRLVFEKKSSKIMFY